MSAYCFLNRNDGNSLLLGTEENINLQHMTFCTLINYSDTYSDMYKLKKPLGGVPRKKMLLKFENINGDE